MAIVFAKMKHMDEGRAGLLIKGHANYAKRGDDIVCAAVSAIGQTAIVGCMDKVGEGNVTVKHHAKGNIVFDCQKTVETEAIIDAAVCGLEHVRDVYPQCFARC